MNEIQNQMEQMARAKKADTPPPKCDAIMLDLETLATRADAVILSIGACKFDSKGTYVDDSAFYTAVSMNSQMPQRHIDPDTLAWWMNQSAEARAVFNDPVKMHLQQALQDLTAWAADDSMLLYSNGGDFDIPIISHALGYYGMKQLVKFWNNRCFRTMKNEWKNVPPPPREGAHNALLDAIFQAKHLQAINQYRKDGTIAVPPVGFSAKG